MTLENVAWFAIGAVAGYYVMAHYRRTNKAF